MDSLRNKVFLAGDLVGWALIPTMALWLRLGDSGGVAQLIPEVTLYTFLAIVLKFSAMYGLGLYRRYWRHASLDELLSIVLAMTIAVLGAGVLHYLVDGRIIEGASALPRSIPVLDGMMSLLFVGGMRLIPRIGSHVKQRLSQDSGAEKVIVIGAGASGTMIARELRSNPELGLSPVAFVDDDPLKLNRTVQGLPVIGTRQDIARIAPRLRVQKAIIAMPRSPGRVIRETRDYCAAAGLSTQTVPGMFEILSGRVKVNELRDVQIEDLLRREPVQTDQKEVENLVKGETVLVTGAGGSIGSEICRQVARLGVGKLVLLGHGENSIFQAYNEFTTRHPEIDIVPVIADVRHKARVAAVFRDLAPRVVFHAAAHKHVPMMEVNPAEAITNNVGGTLSVVQAAERAGVERFVLISTDKAVHPINVMGVTKLVAEMIVHDAAVRTGAPLVSVRFGNVLGSRGSVVPLFKQQIAAGGPITVTDKDMTRYFMTIPESVQLVLQAAAMGQGGETFVLDMGEPVRIEQLARDLVQLSGLEVGQDIDIVFTGLRPGEKMREELFTGDETHRKTVHDKIMIGRNGSRFELPDGAVQRLVRAAEAEDFDAISAALDLVLPAHDRDDVQKDFSRWRRFTYVQQPEAAVQ